MVICSNSKCGCQYEANQPFCSRCGAKCRKLLPKKSKVLFVVALICFVVTAFLAFFPGSSKSINKDMDELSDSQIQTVKQAKKLTPEEILKKKYPVIVFGSYIQDDLSSPTPIEWYVLNQDENSQLIISCKGLDAKAYYNRKRPTTWAECTLRGWLNNEFYIEAFNQDERSQILLTNLKNPSNEQYRIAGGKNTEDKIFMLTPSEANRYFSQNERYIKPTAYAKKNEAFVDSSGRAMWWLRAPGRYTGLATYVNVTGEINNFGSYVKNPNLVVRPVLRKKI